MRLLKIPYCKELVMKCQKSLFAFMFILMLTCNFNVNAQEASPERTAEAESVIADVLDDAGEELQDAVAADESATEEAAKDVSADDEATVDDEGENVDDDDDLDDDESEEYNNSPISIRVNEAGELVGQAQAFVSGNWLPVEANICLLYTSPSPRDRG